jgi:hypothetical protein
MTAYGAKPSFGVMLRVIRPAGDADVPPNGASATDLWVYSAAVAILASRKAGITSFAKRSRSSSWMSSGVPSGVAQMTRSRPG